MKVDIGHDRDGRLRQDFPQAQMDVVVGPKAVSLFANNPNFGVKVFDKRSSLKQKITWFLDLYKTHYDCVVDLRRTALALFLVPRYATPLLDVSKGPIASTAQLSSPRPGRP